MKNAIDDGFNIKPPIYQKIKMNGLDPFGIGQVILLTGTTKRG